VESRSRGPGGLAEASAGGGRTASGVRSARRRRWLRDAGRVTAIDIAVDGAGLSFEADRDGWLRQIGFRPRTDDGPPIQRGAFPPEAFPLAYPVWGQDVRASPALRLTSHDGRQTGYPVLAGYERQGGDHQIRLTDEQARLTVDLRLRTHPGGVIEQSAEISHDQPGPITLHEAAAAAPTLHAPRPWLIRFQGDWAAEWTESAGPVPIGETVLESFGAIRPCLQASPFVLVAPDGPAREDAGTVLAGSLAWGGGIRLAFSRRIAQPDQLRVRCGHQPIGYVLDPGQVFCTPRMIWAWSQRGTRPLTHRLHHWVRAHGVRDGERLRPVVFNTWETTYFDFDRRGSPG
jgi:alpha-galactosidase